ncbi:MAG: hypothetical protein K0S65_815 [Labilithrix sp.]|nr:hypothetical protein [Labilithrix sp.]
MLPDAPLLPVPATPDDDSKMLPPVQAAMPSAATRAPHDLIVRRA